MDATPQVIPSNVDFATEVKSDRLALLARVTLAASIILMMLSSTLLTMLGFSALTWLVAPAALLIFSIMTTAVLKSGNLDLAATLYTIGSIAAVTVTLFDSDPMIIRLTPYFFVVIVFITGLLFSPQITFIFTVISAFLSVAVPVINLGSWALIDWPQGFAIALMFISAGLAAQVTGELYAVTQWALENYKRERRTNQDLFESRLALEKSLRRTESLANQLKETNKDLEEARQAAEMAKKFRGQFLANMSHELRTPLNAIIGFSETMLKFPMMYNDEPLPEAYTADLNQIYNSGRQLLHLINDILDLARVDAGKLEVYMQQVELTSIIKAVNATANGLLAGKPVELRSILPDPMPHAWADESRVRQVLLNLYSNATKFTDKGSITLEVKDVDDGILISLADTGSGIEESQLANIFEEFRQADAAGRDPRSGSGLGLAISRQLLNLMGGKIWVESELGKGSTFYILLQHYERQRSGEVTDSEQNGISSHGDTRETLEAAVPTGGNT